MGLQVNYGKTWRSDYKLEFWKVQSRGKSEARLAIEGIGGKRKEQGRERRTTNRVVPSPNYKRASACRARSQGERQQEKHAAWKEIANRRGERSNGKKTLELKENSGKTTF